MRPAFFVAWRTNFQRNLSIYRNIMRVCFCFRQYIQNLLKKTNRSCTKVFSRLKFLHVVICPLETLHSWATSFLTIHLLFKCCLWTHALLSPFLKKCLLMVHNYAPCLVLPSTFIVTTVFDLYPDEPNHHLCCGYCRHQMGDDRHDTTSLMAFVWEEEKENTAKLSRFQATWFWNDQDFVVGLMCGMHFVHRKLGLNLQLYIFGNAIAHSVQLLYNLEILEPNSNHPSISKNGF